jgi:hypothetical protein
MTSKTSQRKFLDGNMPECAKSGTGPDGQARWTSRPAPSGRPLSVIFPRQSLWRLSEGRGNLANVANSPQSHRNATVPQRACHDARRTSHTANPSRHIICYGDGGISDRVSRTAKTIPALQTFPNPQTLRGEASDAATSWWGYSSGNRRRIWDILGGRFLAVVAYGPFLAIKSKWCGSYAAPS